MKNVTIWLDGTNITCRCPNNQDKKNYKSTKTKSLLKSAYNIIGACDSMGQWTFITDAYPGNSCRDTVVLDLFLDQFLQSISGEDIIVTDRGFTKYRGDFNLLVGHKKPRGRDLTEIQKSENTLIRKVQKHIDNNFGDLKNTFKVLQTGYRFCEDWSSDVIKNCFALHNIHRFVDFNPLDVPDIIDICFDPEHLAVEGDALDDDDSSEHVMHDGSAFEVLSGAFEDMSGDDLEEDHSDSSVSEL